MISVALPVRNGADFLDEALRSVASQTYEDYELLICDNASTDATPDIADSYARGDGRVRLIRADTPVTQQENFTRAIVHSRGPWVKLLCHDDTLKADCLAEIARCIATLPSERVGLIRNGEVWLFDGRTTGDDPPSRSHRVWDGRAALRAMAVGRGPVLPATTTATVRRDVFMQHGPFDARFTHFDTFYWCQLLVTHDLVCLEGRLTVNRIHADQVAVRSRRTLASVLENQVFWAEFVRDHTDDVGLNRLQAALLKRRGVAQLASAAAIDYFCNGPLSASRLVMSSPIKWSPFLPPLLVRSFLATRWTVNRARGAGVSARELFPG
jgi:glycosyltransferase involved in cell wall biosynthesis